MAHRVREVLAAGAAAADCDREQPRRLLDRQAAGVIGRFAAHDAGVPRHLPRRRAQRDPAHLVDPPGHLARPDAVERLGHPVRRQTVGDAVARAAAIEPEHQARPLGRAAIVARIEAEAAVIAVEKGRPRLGEVEIGVPHQRAVGEHPDRLAALAQRRDRRRHRIDRVDRDIGARRIERARHRKSSSQISHLRLGQPAPDHAAGKRRAGDYTRICGISVAGEMRLSSDEASRRRRLRRHARDDTYAAMTRFSACRSCRIARRGRRRRWRPKSRSRSSAAARNARSAGRCRRRTCSICRGFRAFATMRRASWC